MKYFYLLKDLVKESNAKITNQMENLFSFIPYRNYSYYIQILHTYSLNDLELNSTGNFRGLILKMQEYPAHPILMVYVQN